MEVERRRSTRISRSLLVQFFDSNANVWNSATIRNISDGGICFNTDSIFTAKQLITLRFKLPNNPQKPLEITARVIESRKYFARLEFIEMTGEQKILIKDYILWFLNKGGNVT